MEKLIADLDHEWLMSEAIRLTIHLHTGWTHKGPQYQYKVDLGCPWLRVRILITEVLEIPRGEHFKLLN